MKSAIMPDKLEWNGLPGFISNATCKVLDDRYHFGRKCLRSVILLMMLCSSSASMADDPRQLVELPAMMQQHMMSNMRDHLLAVNEILVNLGNNEMDKAADIAEQRLGMSSLKRHGAGHMAKYMPEGMARAGTGMHKAASRFALTAQEGDLLAAYRALTHVTSACVNCHAGYRLR